MAIAACVLVKNAASHIAEWIAHHFAIGFDVIILIDNMSTDDTWQSARQCQHMGRLMMKQWSHPSPFFQMLCYADVCNTLGSLFEWIAFIDDDEYVVSADGSQVQELLRTCDKASAVGLNWLMFGSSGHVNTPDGLMTENFTRRAPDDFGPNRHFKSIIRPYKATGCHCPHSFTVIGNYVDPHGADLVWDGWGMTAKTPVDPNWRLQHYFVRSREQWLKKLARGYCDPTVRKASDFDDYDRNEIEDRSALRWSGEVRAMLSLQPLGDKPLTQLPSHLRRDLAR